MAPTGGRSASRGLLGAEVLQELRVIGALAFPVVIQTASQQGMTVTDQVFLGHLGTAELGAAALANAFTNLMWFFLLGFTSALDTLGSHAYGAGDRRALSAVCTTAFLLVTLMVAPVAVGMAQGERVGAALFGQDPTVAALMGRFCTGLIPGMWPMMWGIVLTKYLQVQNIMLVPSLIAVATFGLNIAFNALLIRAMGFGGAPLATTLSRTAQFFMLAAAVWAVERRRARKGRGGEAGFEAQALSQGAGLDAGMELGAVAFVAAAAGDCRAMEAGGSGRGSLAADASGSGRHRRRRGGAGEEGDTVRLLAGAGSGSEDGMEEVSIAEPGAAGPGPAGDPARAEARRGAGRGGEEGEEDERRPLWDSVRRGCAAALRPRVVGKFLRLGIPGGLSMAFEAGAFDFSTVLAGRLGAVATAAHAALLSVVTFTYLACPFAIATAGSIRVGNLLGAGHAQAAARAGAIVVALSGGFMALMGLVIVACHAVLGYMFTSDERVVKEISGLAFFAALFQVSDGLLGSSQGVLRGCGHQHITAVFNFFGFWVCGVLLGYLLCFRAGLGLKGLWGGITSGDTITAALNLGATARIRWQAEADKAAARLKAMEQQEQEAEPMLPAAGPLSDGIDDGIAHSIGGAGGSSAVGVGGGRSYAGGLKRIWSQRQAAEARKRSGLERSESRAARLMRSLSSMFRRGGTDGVEEDGVGAAETPRHRAGSGAECQRPELKAGVVELA